MWHLHFPHFLIINRAIFHFLRLYKHFVTVPIPTLFLNSFIAGKKVINQQIQYNSNTHTHKRDSSWNTLIITYRLNAQTVSGYPNTWSGGCLLVSTTNQRCTTVIHLQYSSSPAIQWSANYETTMKLAIKIHRKL